MWLRHGVANEPARIVAFDPATGKEREIASGFMGAGPFTDGRYAVWFEYERASGSMVTRPPRGLVLAEVW